MNVTEGAVLCRVREPAAIASALGLSTAHIVTGFVLEVAEGGQFLRLGVEEGGAAPDEEQEGGGKRGKVEAFSRGSRTRLMREVAKINREAAGLPSFQTLTYPGEWPRNGRIVKAHFRAFRMALARAFPEVWGLWRLEYQRRGAPHFHLLLWGADGWEEGGKEWLSRTWFRIVASGDERHLRAGTRWEQVREWNGVAHYCAKYLGKCGETGVPEEVEGCGRFWGKIGKERWAVQLIEVEISARAFHRVRRVMRKHVERKTGRKLRTWGRGKGLTVFMGEAAGLRLAQWAREEGGGNERSGSRRAFSASGSSGSS